METRFRKKIILGSSMMGLIVIASLVLIAPSKSKADSAPCTLGQCPKEITIADNGATLTYRAGRRFSVVLNRYTYLPDELTCIPTGILEKTKSIEDLFPNQLQRFMGTAPGTCLLTNKDFTVSITIVGTTTEIVSR